MYIDCRTALGGATRFTYCAKRTLRRRAMPQRSRTQGKSEVRDHEPKWLRTTHERGILVVFGMEFSLRVASRCLFEMSAPGSVCLQRTAAVSIC